MNLLLDTQAILWWLTESSRLGLRARALIADPGNAAWVSAASVWEIAIKTSTGKLEMKGLPDERLPHEFARHRFRELPVTITHALAVGRLPRHHADPFDRLLVVQARLEGLTLVTSDSVLSAYGVPIERADV